MRTWLMSGARYMAGEEADAAEFLWARSRSWECSPLSISCSQVTSIADDDSSAFSLDDVAPPPARAKPDDEKALDRPKAREALVIVAEKEIVEDEEKDDDETDRKGEPGKETQKRDEFTRLKEDASESKHESKLVQTECVLQEIMSLKAFVDSLLVREDLQHLQGKMSKTIGEKGDVFEAQSPLYLAAQEIVRSIGNAGVDTSNHPAGDGIRSTDSIQAMTHPPEDAGPKGRCPDPASDEVTYGGSTSGSKGTNSLDELRGSTSYTGSPSLGSKEVRFTRSEMRRLYDDPSASKGASGLTTGGSTWPSEGESGDCIATPPVGRGRLQHAFQLGVLERPVRGAGRRRVSGGVGLRVRERV